MKDNNEDKLYVLLKQDSEDLSLVSVVGIFGHNLKDKNVLDSLKMGLIKANKHLIEDKFFDDNDVETWLKFLIKNKKVSNGFYICKLAEVDKTDVITLIENKIPANIKENVDILERYCLDRFHK